VTITLKKVKIKDLSKYLILLVLLVIMLIIPYMRLSAFLMRTLIRTLYVAFIAEGWNILAGYIGYLSLGHAAFFGLGAYTSCLLFDFFMVSPWLGMFAGAAVATAFSLAIGYPSLRLKGKYFVIVTLAFSEVLRLIFLQWEFVGGAVGLWIQFMYRKWFGELAFLPAYFQFWPNLNLYYYVALAFLIVELFILQRILKSRLGYYFVAIREEEDAASSLGINLTKYKLIGAAISGALVAIGGTFYAFYVQYVDPYSTMSTEISVTMMLVVLVGGMGTLMGPIIGSFILTPISEYVRAFWGGKFYGLHLVIYGVIMIAVVIIKPEGLIGPITKGYNFLLKKIGMARGGGSGTS
jgi:branched-chain amino acid transport system permease protein